MNKKLKILIYGVTILLLTATVIAGILYTIENFQKYGLNYEVTTIIQGVETVTIERASTNIFAFAFITWIIVLLVYSTTQTRSEKKDPYQI